MIITKLPIPPRMPLCPTCEKRFYKTLHVIILDKIIVHKHFYCWSEYLIKKQSELPEKQRDRFGKYDADFRFTEDYEKSDLSITKEELEEYKKIFSGKVFLPANPTTVKTIIRDRIWEAVGKKYAQQLQYIRALNRIYERNKTIWTSGFFSTFVPSVLSQFKAKGYLSKRQWELIIKEVDQNIDEADRAYFSNALANAQNIKKLELPDTMRYLQRRNSFLKWYNEKNRLKEKEDEE